MQQPKSKFCTIYNPLLTELREQGLGCPDPNSWELASVIYPSRAAHRSTPPTTSLGEERAGACCYDLPLQPCRWNSPALLCRTHGIVSPRLATASAHIHPLGIGSMHQSNASRLQCDPHRQPSAGRGPSTAKGADLHGVPSVPGELRPQSISSAMSAGALIPPQTTIYAQASAGYVRAFVPGSGTGIGNSATPGVELSSTASQTPGQAYTSPPIAGQGSSSKHIDRVQGCALSSSSGVQGIACSSAAAFGWGHMLQLTAHGHVLGAGCNRHGQVATLSASDEPPAARHAQSLAQTLQPMQDACGVEHGRMPQPQPDTGRCVGTKLHAHIYEPAAR